MSRDTLGAPVGRSSNNVELHRIHYRKKFVESLDRCALHRFGSEDRFLFHARLTLEAGVRAVYTKTGKTPTKGTADLLKELQAGHVHATQVADFEVIRTRTNPAAHVPVPGESIQRDSGKKVADNLKPLWEWVASHIDFPDAERERIDHALSGIAGNPARESPDQELDRLRKEVGELRARVLAEERRSGPSRRRATDGGSSSWWRALGGLALGLVAGGVMGAWFPRVAHEATELAELRVEADGGTHDASTDDATLDAGDDAADTLSAPATEMTIEASPPSRSAVASCPESMTLVEAGTLELAPPADRQWCRGRACSRRNVEVSSFCIMDRVVLLSDLRNRFPNPEARCRYDITKSAAHCVSTQRATDYCEASFGTGARLPSVAELELVHRSEVGVSLPVAPRDPSNFEWTHDRCPSPSFGGTPTPTKAHASAGRIGSPPQLPTAQISWHCQPDAPTPTHQFRCVLPVE